MDAARLGVLDPLDHGARERVAADVDRSVCQDEATLAHLVEHVRIRALRAEPDVDAAGVAHEIDAPGIGHDELGLVLGIRPEVRGLVEPSVGAPSYAVTMDEVLHERD